MYVRINFNVFEVVLESYGQHGHIEGSIDASQLQGLGFEPELWRLSAKVQVFPVSTWVSSVYSSFLPPPRNMLEGGLTTLHCP